MAAEYGININVRTKDADLIKLQKNLTAADRKVASLTKQLDNLSKKTGKGPGSGGPFSKAAIAKTKELAEATKLAQHNFEKYTRGVLNSESANRKGIVSTRELATRMKDVAASVGITNEKFGLFTAGFTKLNFSAQIKSLQRFNESAKVTASTFGAMGSKNVPGVTGFSNADISTLLNFTPANTINAIERYLDTLTGVRKQLDFTEKEYGDVTARIKEMNAALEKQRTLLRENNKEEKKNKISRRDRFDARDIRQRIAESPGGRLRRFRRNRTAEDRRIRNQVGSSALIGGAFPLLFGQGIGASAGGFAGGAAGGLLGGQFGFALSLVGTQLGAQLDILAQAAIKTGNALADFNKDTDALIDSLGLTNSAFSQRIKLLEQAEGKEAAYNVVLARTTAIVGQGGVDALKEFGDQTREITKGFSQFFLIVQAGLARIISFSRLLKGLGDGLQNLTVGERLRKSSSSELQKIGNRIAELEGKSGRLSGTERVELRELKRKGITGLSEFDVTETNRLGFDAISKSLRQEIELTNESTFIKRQKIKVDREVNELAKQFQELTKQTLNQEQLDLLRQYVEATNELALGSRLVNDELVKLDEEFIKLNDSGFQLVELSRTIGSSFEDSFKGVIQGTMGVSEAFRNMLNKIANHFLDAAAKMAANRLATGLLGMFSGGSGVSGGIINQVAGNVGGILSKSTSGIDPKVPSGVQAPGLFNITPVPLTPSQVRNNRRGTAFKQYGGSVTRGKSYLVGERGEEVFTPGMTGQITSNSGMGSVNVSVNVDASGTSVEGNQPNGEELGRLIGAAVQTELIKEKRPGGLLG
jgi:hypothetical protein